LRDWLLGVHSGHNASACIGDRTGLQFAIQEERLTGEKNYWGFPEKAIAACLASVAVNPAEVDVVVGGQQVLMRYHDRAEILKAYKRQHTLAGKLRQRIAMPLVLSLSSDYGQKRLRRALGELGFSPDAVSHFDHHTAHAATAYYGLRTDPDEPLLVLTVDGDGDNLCATSRIMAGGRERDLVETTWDNSLGAIYSWVTYALGFVPLEHEYKLMGMAPYAEEAASERVAAIFERYLETSSDGLRFERRTAQRISDTGPQLSRDLRGLRFDHVCGGLQLYTERLLSNWVQATVRVTGIGKVVAAGGVFMNVKANRRIASLPEVESFQAFPSCGDETLPLGAYYLESARRHGPENVATLENFYLGDEPSETEIDTALAETSWSHTRPSEIGQAVAEILAAGHPVARCAGRMEYGARALGNRSILADPSQQDVVRVINRMIKKRDFWMPFAPLVLRDRHERYLDNAKKLDSPYMMMTFDSRENFRELIAAVHPADLTCRPQILRPEQNPEVGSILEAFEAKTGRAVLLNTSFNLHGFPIVRTAAEALYVFENSGLEYLQLGSRIVQKA